MTPTDTDSLIREINAHRVAERVRRGIVRVERYIESTRPAPKPRTGLQTALEVIACGLMGVILAFILTSGL